MKALVDVDSSVVSADPVAAPEDVVDSSIFELPENTRIWAYSTSSSNVVCSIYLLEEPAPANPADRVWKRIPDNLTVSADEVAHFGHGTHVVTAIPPGKALLRINNAGSAGSRLKVVVGP